MKGSTLGLVIWARWLDMLYTNYQDMGPLCNAPNSLYLHGVILRAFLIYSQNTTYPLHIFGREKKKSIKFQNSNYYDIPHTPQTDKDGLSLKLLDYILQITFLTVDDLKSQIVPVLTMLTKAVSLRTAQSTLTGRKMSPDPSRVDAAGTVCQVCHHLS